MTRGLPHVGDLLFTTETPMGNVCMVHSDRPFALAQRSRLHDSDLVTDPALVILIMGEDSLAPPQHTLV